MPNSLLAGAVIGVHSTTIISKITLMIPKSIALFYVTITKACYVPTEKKQITCGVVARGVNKLQFKTWRIR